MGHESWNISESAQEIHTVVFSENVTSENFQKVWRKFVLKNLSPGKVSTPSSESAFREFWIVEIEMVQN